MRDHLLIADTDDAKLHRVTRLLLGVLLSLELDFHCHINDLPAEITHYLLKVTPWQGNGVPAPFPSHPDDHRIRVLLQPRQEEPAVFVDQRKAEESVEPENKQHQPASQPAPYWELAPLVSAFVSKYELLKRLDRGVVNEMKLRTGLIRVSRWKLAKEPMQPFSGCIGDQHLTK